MPATTLRWYERVGVIEPPQRVGGKRRYDPAVLMRLMLIRVCRVAGLGLDQIREVVGDGPDRRRTKEIAAERVAAIDAQIESLQLARDLMLATLRCECADPEACGCGAMAPIIPRLRAALDG